MSEYDNSNVMFLTLLRPPRATDVRARNTAPTVLRYPSDATAAPPVLYPSSVTPPTGGVNTTIPL